MVLKGHIRIFAVLIIFSMLVLFFSCEKPGSNIIYCSECLSEEPFNAKIRIKLDYYNETTVTIYEGNLEDNVVYESIITEAKYLYRTLALNRTYTFTASYYVRGNHYIVVNSLTPHVIYDEDYCEEPCYYVYNNEVDLRLKYGKRGDL
ncbi:MAG: hypothetical protein A2V64_09940 [Bacteroidetes bacterium RBG_13_43_22]|nr:MAG: hypothetical protein A2V64_09940 [Bacteroidetes bacterium RBG_13_43_22]